MTPWRRLWFIRHAETDLAGRFCGSSDPGLNERGRGQLPGLIEKLRAFPLGGVYCSGLARARETAEAIASPRGLPVATINDLREISFGAWEGMTWEEIEARDPAYARRWIAEFPAHPAPGGEAIAAFRGRVLRALEELRNLGDGDVAVVTHAGVLRVLLEELGHYPAHHAWERTREYGGVIGCLQGVRGGQIQVS